MEKFMYPSKTMRITQGYFEGSHACYYAIDEGSVDTGRSTMIAPYTGVVKQIYPQYENQVFFESCEPVEFADGTVDYAVTLLEHQNSPMAYGMAIGKRYAQGENFYVEGGRSGGKNNVVDSHVHLEFAKGKYTGWHKTPCGVYALNNGQKPQDCCFIDNSYKILNDRGYKFVNLDKGIWYQAHVQDIGDQDWKHDGETAGTTGKRLRMEGLRIDFNGDVYAKVHVQHKGWIDLGKITKDTLIGTKGEGLAIECLCLKGDFKYRVHIADFGWTPWTKADGICTLGTVGMSMPIEAIQIKKLG